MLPAVVPALFSGTQDWGFGASDIWSSALLVVGSVSGFLVLRIVIKFAPTIFTLLFKALGIGGGKA